MNAKGASPELPPKWTAEALDDDRRAAIRTFVDALGAEGTREYVRLFQELQPLVAGLFEASADLTCFRDSVFADDDLMNAARFLGSPPLSEDNLKTLLQATAGVSKPSDCSTEAVLDVIRPMWDPIRFPWVETQRPPTPQERAAAIEWTTGIWAIERVRTRRRVQSSHDQEEKVADALAAAGFQQVARRRIDRLDELERGSFSREAVLAGSKCDLPVRLGDGRLLALECKVSNSALNSVKRLIRETGGKARTWRNAFGLQVMTGAVLAGVYKLGNLVQAQEDYEVSIFWEHDLRPLIEFVSATR